MKELVLRNGQIALVDDEDFDRASQFTWRLDSDGYVCRMLRINGKRTRVTLHNFVNPPPEGMLNDHKHHNLLDNRKSQLRFCSYKENGRNRQKQISATSSKFKGVCFNNLHLKWMVRIGIGGGKSKTVGYFRNEIAAAKAYNAVAKVRYEEFACLNTIPGISPATVDLIR